LDSAINEKLLKYSHLSDEVLVIAVGYNHARSNMPLTEVVMDKLVRVYRSIVSVVNNFIKETGQDAPHDYEIPDRVKEQPSKLNMKPHSEETRPTWQSFFSRIREGRQGERVRSVPFFTVKETSDLPPCDCDEWLYHKFSIVAATRSYPSESQDWEAAEQVKPLSHTDKDYAKVIFTETEKITLAKTGLRAKRFIHNHEIRLNTLHKKKPLSVDSDCSTLSEFLRSQDVRSDKWQEMANNLDLVLREVVMNAKRSTKGYEFIIRKLINKPVYVFISNTQYSTTSVKPQFYSVLYHGSPDQTRCFGRHQLLKFTGDHQDETDFTGWYVTEFCSTDRRRSEHLIGLPFQLSSLYKMADEQLLLSNQTHAHRDLCNHMFLILISDNNSLSLTLQQLRYYYMELYSGFPDSHKRSLKVLDKFPTPLRSLYQVWLLNKLCDLHPPRALQWSTEPLEVKIEDELSQLELDFARDSLPSQSTPFGFHITNLDLLLLASYLCMLKNKNEQNEGHDAKVILEKILKREYEFADDPRPALSFSDPSELRTFQCNPDYIDWGCWLMKRRVMSMTGSNWQTEFSKVFSMMKESQQLLSTFSTKSSSTQGPTKVKTLDDLKEYDIRSKVFLELLKMEGRFDEVKLHDMTQQIIDDCETDVSLFKKNQIGGAREIYILKFSFRLMVKIIEDYARCICKLHPCEKLTKPASRDIFVLSHEHRVDKLRKKHKVTLRWSGDMTNWANLMMNEFFERFLTNMLPAELMVFAKQILQKHRNKRLHLPKALIKSFLKVSNELTDKNLMRLRDEFTGKSKTVLCEQFSTHITNVTNMMQGILHYLSSAYHCSHLEVLTALLENLSTQEVKVLVDFEVSSDDEGLMISAVSDNKEELLKFTRHLRSDFFCIKETVDALFGVRTSWQKSTLNCSPIFEFNSTFRAYNNVAQPLIKFVARSVDDNVSESLHSRVTGLHSLVRQVRESGGSGELCNHIMKQQQGNLLRNIGSSVCSWFDQNLFSSLPNLSVLGRYEPLAPEIAGLVGVDYQNWLACKDSEFARKVMAVMACWTVIEFRDAEVQTTYNMFPRAKYDKALKSVGLSPSRQSLTENGIRLMLKTDLGPAEQFELIKIRALTPGVASSFAWLSRTDNVMMAPYLLLRRIFHGETFLGLLDKLRDSDVSVNLQDIYPQHMEYSRLFSLSQSNLTYSSLARRPRRTKKLYHPVVATPLHKKNLNKLLARLWFNEPSGLGEHETIMQLDSLMMDLKWLKSDITESLSSSPFSDLMTMMAFFHNYSKSAEPLNLFTYGGGRKHNFIEDVIKFNTYPMRSAATLEITSNLQQDHSWMALEDRFSNWSTLLGNLKVLPDAAFEDLVNLMNFISDETLDRACRQSDVVRRQFAINIKSLMKDYTDVQLMEESSIGSLFYVKPQPFRQGRYVGYGEVLIRLKSGVVRAELFDESVTRIIHKGELLDLDAVLSKYGLRRAPNIVRNRSTVTSSSKVQLSFNSGFRISTSTGYGNKFSGFKTNVIHNIPVPVEGIVGDFLSDIMNNTMRASDLTALARVQSALSDMVIEQIKAVRKGSHFIRVFERLNWDQPEIDQPELPMEHTEMDMGPVQSFEEVEALYESLMEIWGVGQIEQEWTDPFLETLGADLFNNPVVREWDVEARIENPCYLKWASMVNVLITQSVPEMSRFRIKGDPQPPPALNPSFREKWIRTLKIRKG
jgi:hypothetical protein